MHSERKGQKEQGRTPTTQGQMPTYILTDINKNRATQYYKMYRTSYNKAKCTENLVCTARYKPPLANIEIDRAFLAN